MDCEILGEKFPIKSWLPEADLGEKALVQARNLANLPFAFRHVAIMPDAHPGYGMPIGGVLVTEHVVVPNAVGLDIGCFPGDTKIRLLDNKDHAIRDLASREKPFLVYACSPQGRVGLAFATSKLTRRAASLVAVTLDNGEVVRCTPDHLFMLRDGTFCSAFDLREGSSLMPLAIYTTGEGYLSVRQNSSRSGWPTPVHKMVANSGLLGPRPEIKGQRTVEHHVDLDPANNLPENIVFMGDRDHAVLHRSIPERNTYWQSPEFERRRLAKIRELRETRPKEWYGRKAEVGTLNLAAAQAAHPEAFAANYESAGRRGAATLRAWNIANNSRKISCPVCQGLVGRGGLPNHLKAHARAGESCGNNHKVVSVTPLEQAEDVYCLTVPGYGNFGLSAGVFVHNCGMALARTTLQEIDRATRLRWMEAVRTIVPVGFQHQTEPQHEDLLPAIEPIGVTRTEYESARRQLGTLGGGNHFIELQAGSDGFVYVMIHSGSRNLGKRVADHYNKLAKEANARWHVAVPRDFDLAFLPINTDEGRNYLHEMAYCVDFAKANRGLMLIRVLEVLVGLVGGSCTDVWDVAHNYAAVEHHFGRDVIVHRKGATRARAGDRCVIPGSQGSSSFLCTGLGNRDAFASCSHGAGRCLGRREAVRTLSLEAEKKRLDDRGIVHAVRGSADLEEAAGAYKDIDQVMARQADLVRVDVRLEPLAVIKGPAKA